MKPTFNFPDSLPILYTERLILRPVQESDQQGFFELDSDPLVHTYIKCQISTPEEALANIHHVQRQYDAIGLGRVSIIHRKTGEFVGWAGLKYETGIRETPYFDLGYRLKRAFWGQGIGTEAARESLRFGFEDLKLDQICAAAHVDNEGSNRILTKLGMDQTETFDFEGAPHHWYSINRSE